MIYKFKAGSRVSGVKAQAVGEELQKLRDRDGRIETLVVLNEAKKKRSPLHNAFEWDDSVAAHQHRLYQARHLIRSMEIIIEDRPEPAFVHIKVNHGGYYQSTEVAVQNVDEWELVRTQAIRHLQSASVSLDVLDQVAVRINHANRGTVKSVRSAVDRAAEQLSAS